MTGTVRRVFFPTSPSSGITASRPLHYGCARRVHRAGPRSTQRRSYPSTIVAGRLAATPTRRGNDTQTLVGCAFCDAPLGTDTGEAHTGDRTSGSLTRSTLTVLSRRSRTPTNAITSPVTVVDWSSTRSRRSRIRVELGHLGGPLQLGARCSPGGLATYWTRNLEERLVATAAE